MKRTIIILAAALVAANFWTPKLQAAHVVERIIARVNSEIITQRQFEREQVKLHDELAQQYSGAELETKVNDESKNLLRNLIDTSLMVQKAKDESVNVEADLIKRLDQQRKQYNLNTIDDLEKEAETQGVNWEDYKDQFRRQLLMQEVISRDVGSRIVITRAEELKFYNEHKEQFKTGGMVHLADILISTDKYKPEEAEKRAKDAEAELKSGERFSDVVKKYSDGNNADQGGDLSFMKTDTVAPVIGNAISKLDINDYSEPIRLKNGYMILQLKERMSAGIPKFDEVESHVQETLYSQEMGPKMREYLTELRKDSYIFLAPGYIDTGADTPGALLTPRKNAMKQVFVKDLAPDHPVRSTFLVQSKERKISSTGGAYLDLNLQDTTGVISAKLWDYSERTTPAFEVDAIILVDGYVESYRGAPQLRVKKIALCPPEDVSLLDYLPRTRRDPEEMFAALLTRVRSMEEGPLRVLLLSILEDPCLSEKYKLAPAAMTFHHAFLGGLLEHVSSLIEVADQVVDHYPWLRRDLIVAGLVLHDIGKTEELIFTAGFRYSTRGQLIGHITMGLELVQTKIREIPDFPAQLKQELEHIILSHHGKLEFGSPKEPMFAEALVVNFLDEMDSKLEAVRALYAADRERPGDWTSRSAVLKRELLKPPKSV